MLGISIETFMKNDEILPSLIYKKRSGNPRSIFQITDILGFRLISLLIIMKNYLIFILRFRVNLTSTNAI